MKMCGTNLCKQIYFFFLFQINTITLYMILPESVSISLLFIFLIFF